MVGLTPGEEYARRLSRDALRSGELTPILPRHGVYLRSYSRRTRHQEPRFADLFAATFRRLPLEARRRILGWWRKNRRSFNPFAPEIVLATREWMGKTRQERRGVWALVTKVGTAMYFHAATVATTPDHVVCDLIAHELAHVYQWASGWRPTGDPAQDSLDEEHANKLVVLWGFEVDTIDDWAERDPDVDVSTPAGRRPRRTSPGVGRSRRRSGP
jgi:hypothetical protein